MFIYSEEAKNFCEIFTLLLSYVVPVKSKVKISQNIVAWTLPLSFTLNSLKDKIYWKTEDPDNLFLKNWLFHRWVIYSSKQSDWIAQYLNINRKILFLGWLYKQGAEGLMLWKKRWFALSEFVLYYHRSPDDTVPSGSIPLPSYKISPGM